MVEKKLNPYFFQTAFYGVSFGYLSKKMHFLYYVINYNVKYYFR